MSQTYETVSIWSPYPSSLFTFVIVSSKKVEKTGETVDKTFSFTTFTGFNFLEITFSF